VHSLSSSKESSAICNLVLPSYALLSSGVGFEEYLKYISSLVGGRSVLIVSLILQYPLLFSILIASAYKPGDRITSTQERVQSHSVCPFRVAHLTMSITSPTFRSVFSAGQILFGSKLD
jgi:hypothetical protein